MSRLEADLPGLPWQKVRDDVQVKLPAREVEVYVPARMIGLCNFKPQKDYKALISKGKRD